MPLQLDDLQLLESADAASSGAPLLLPTDAIDEDPSQPRQEFDECPLRELAATIAERGVRQPISVRRHPEIPGRWVLNFGARRLRASKLAGKSHIPAFVDDTADFYDQVIENEQREPLKPLELALFVRRRLAAGESQSDIARRLGKSRQYITFATALIDAPDWLIGAYREGRCRGMTELYELRKLHGQHPDDVEAWVSDREPITRDRLAALRASLDALGALKSTSTPHPMPQVTVDSTTSSGAMCAAPTPTEQRQRLQYRLEVDLDGAAFELVGDHVPPMAGEIFIRPVGGGQRRAVPASRLKLLGFVAR